MKTKNKRPSSKILEAATDYSKAPLIVAPNTINSIRTTNGPATNYYPENEDTMEESDLEELEINLSPGPKVKESVKKNRTSIISSNRPSHYFYLTLVC